MCMLDTIHAKRDEIYAIARNSQPHNFPNFLLIKLCKLRAAATEREASDAEEEQQTRGRLRDSRSGNDLTHVVVVKLGHRHLARHLQFTVEIVEFNVERELAAKRGDNFLQCSETHI